MPTSDTPPDDRWRRLVAALTAILALGCARPAPDGAPPATPPDALASWTAAEVPRLREVAGGLGKAGREILTLPRYLTLSEDRS
jgi:hypothetical protein